MSTILKLSDLNNEIKLFVSHYLISLAWKMVIIIIIIWPLILESICIAFQRDRWQMGNYQGGGTLVSLYIIHLLYIIILKRIKSSGLQILESNPVVRCSIFSHKYSGYIIWHYLDKYSRICHEEYQDTKPKFNTTLLTTVFLFSTTLKLPQAKYLLFGKPCYPNQLVALSIHPSHKERVSEHAVCIH